jgi:hypothetical protein
MLAYIDPGAGSVIATFLVGGIASLGVVFRSMRGKIGGVFSRDKGDVAEPSGAVDADR